MFKKILMLAIVFYSASLLAQAVNILGPKNYFVTSRSGTEYRENLAIPANQLTQQYKLFVTNANGQDYSPRNCTGLNFVRRLLCQLENVAIQAYINQFRVHSAIISLNGTTLVNTQSFNKNTLTFTTDLNVLLSNELKINLKGPLLSYISLRIEKTGVATDSTAPTILSSLQSNTLTNETSLRIDINDSSNTVTEVYRGTELVQTETAKSFNLTLTEGENSFVIKARDEFGNQSADFILSQIVLDTTAPVLSSNLKSDYLFNIYPNQVRVEFYPNEILTTLEVNSQAITLNEAGLYVYELPVNSDQSVSLSVRAVDQIGNVLVADYSFNVSSDLVAPVIATPSVPTHVYMQELSYLLPISIQESGETRTYIEVDGQSIGPFTEKSFSYLVQFPQDGTKEIRITATDAAENQSIKTVKITRDTGPFLVEFVSPLPNAVFSEKSFTVQIRANRPMMFGNINGIGLQLSPDGLTAQVPIKIYRYGSMRLSLRVFDIFSFRVDQFIDVTIQGRSIASWDYQECPVE